MGSQGSRSRQKGARYELKIGRILSGWFGCSLRRTPNSGGLHWLSAHSLSGDLIADDPAFPFVVECKHQEKWTLEQVIWKKDKTIRAWWKQTTDACDRNIGDKKSQVEPLLIFTRNHSSDAIMIRGALFHRLKKLQRDEWYYFSCGEQVITALTNLLQINKEDVIRECKALNDPWINDGPGLHTGGND